MKRAILLVIALAVMVGLLALTGGTMAAEANNDEQVNDSELSVGVQQGAGFVTVAVSDENGPVSNATVFVDGLNASDQTTSDIGTTSFDRPNETVNVTILAWTDNATAEKTKTIQGFEGQGPAFTPPGQQTSALVHSLQHATLSGPMGLLLAGTPATGPPDHAGLHGNETGQPDHAGPDGNETGPPDHAGPDENETGPPDHAGPGDDSSDDEDADIDSQRGPPSFVGAKA